MNNLQVAKIITPQLKTISEKHLKFQISNLKSSVFQGVNMSQSSLQFIGGLLGNTKILKLSNFCYENKEDKLFNNIYKTLHEEASSTNTSNLCIKEYFSTCDHTFYKNLIIRKIYNNNTLLSNCTIRQYVPQNFQCNDVNIISNAYNTALNNLFPGIEKLQILIKNLAKFKAFRKESIIMIISDDDFFLSSEFLEINLNTPYFFLKKNIKIKKRLFKFNRRNIKKCQNIIHINNDYKTAVCQKENITNAVIPIFINLLESRLLLILSEKCFINKIDINCNKDSFYFKKVDLEYIENFYFKEFFNLIALNPLHTFMETNLYYDYDVYNQCFKPIVLSKNDQKLNLLYNALQNDWQSFQKNHIKKVNSDIFKITENIFAEYLF